MAFCIVHVMQVHVSPNRRLLLRTVCLKDLGLIALDAAKKEICLWRPRQCVDGVAIERFEVFERPQILVHRKEVPHFELVVKTATQHASAISV